MGKTSVPYTPKLAVLEHLEDSGRLDLDLGNRSHIPSSVHTKGHLPLRTLNNFHPSRCTRRGSQLRNSGANRTESPLLRRQELSIASVTESTEDEQYQRGCAVGENYDLSGGDASFDRETKVCCSIQLK